MILSTVIVRKGRCQSGNNKKIVILLQIKLCYDLVNFPCPPLSMDNFSKMFIFPDFRINSCFIFLGYATYLNIQFSLYNRLKFLQLNPKFSYSTFGVSINVDKEGRRKSHKDNQIPVSSNKHDIKTTDSIHFTAITNRKIHYRVLNPSFIPGILCKYEASSSFTGVFLVLVVVNLKK